ncbi:MAG: carotenoid 1,2-hydratase [Candidatus Eremiobacteraeota bacterium]|nr:carotenoid 1,2-hydratase [Candidatus Eremiobacteraeota bacterium]
MSKFLALAMAFTAALAPYHFHFPPDHAAHDAYRTEWWYFTGHVRANDGRSFGYELTFFRVGLEPHARHLLPGQSRWRGTELYPAHFAITDERARAFTYHETLAREALGQGGSSERRLDVHANGWRLIGAKQGSAYVMHMSAHAGGDSVDFVQRPRKPPAVHGRGGVSRKGSCASCASHYYSFTRLATAGTLRAGGRTYRVSGISWMDHEYGSDELQSDQSGWDWFSLQLDDRRDIMLYRLRRTDGSVTPQSSGSLVDAAGGVRYLPLRDFTIAATGSWTSPHTHARYPSGWIVSVRGIARELRLTPTVADQELVDASGGVTYWEGAVDVTDARNGNHLGVGYVELTGYAGVVRL